MNAAGEFSLVRRSLCRPLAPESEQTNPIAGYRIMQAYISQMFTARRRVASNAFAAGQPHLLRESLEFIDGVIINNNTAAIALLFRLDIHLGAENRL